MQISSSATSHLLTSSRLFPIQTNAWSEVSDSDSLADQAVFSQDPAHFAALVSDAKAMPDVRADVVESFKARISNGTYPSPQTVAGLTRTIGSMIVQRAASGQ